MIFQAVLSCHYSQKKVKSVIKIDWFLHTLYRKYFFYVFLSFYTLLSQIMLINQFLLNTEKRSVTLVDINRASRVPLKLLITVQV